MSDEFLDLAQLDNIPDQTLLEDNTEHEVQIVKAEIGESGEHAKTAGQKYLRVTYKSQEDPDSRPFNDIFMLPIPGQDQDTFNMRGRMLKDFFNCFEFDYRNGFNIYEETDQLKGLTGEVIVRTADNDQYGEQNEVKRYL